MSIADALSLMTPGSVFTNKKGRVAKLLFLTNTSLLTTAPQHIQDEHPVQVVYANENAEVFNRGLDDFIAKYKFYNVDADLEARLENLFVFNENDPVHEAIAQESEAAEETPAASVEFFTAAAKQFGEVARETNKIVASALEVHNEEDDLLLPPQSAAEESKIADQKFLDKHKPSAVTVAFTTMGGGHVLVNEREKLSQSLVAYTQDADITQQLLVHRLTFALDDELTIPALQDLFRPNEEGQDSRSTVDVFDVRTAYNHEHVVWTSYLGVFPEYTKTGLYAAVLLGTDEFRGGDEVAALEAPTDAQDIAYLEAGVAQQDVAPIVGVNPLAHLQDGYTLTEESIRGIHMQTNPDNLISQNDMPSTDAPRHMISLEEVSKLDPQQLSDLVQAFQKAEIDPLPPRGLRNAESIGLVIDPSTTQLFAPRGDVPGAL